MRIDSQHPGYLTGDSRARALDPASQYDPQLPEVPGEVPILVDEDVFEANLRPVGMAPFFGLDGVEAAPPLEYEVGFDGLADTTALFGPLGADVDGINAPGAAFSRLLIVEPIGIDLDHVAAFQRSPAPAAASFHPDDALEPRLAAALRTGTPPQLGDDGLGLAPPGFDIRLPIVGTDEVDYSATPRYATPAPEFRHTGDGIDMARRDRLRFAA
jgi:hypothetical protein